MNYALIFAGGIGQRMNTISLPKQFLKVHGKEIIIHTIEHFQKSNEIDKIVVVCVKEYISLMEELKNKYALTKIIKILPGGKTGQESIYNGLEYLSSLPSGNEDIVLIHDGVRPLINNEVISSNIDCVLKNGTCVTVTKAVETILTLENENVNEVIDRSNCYLGRAPQSFFLKDIYECHLKAKSIGKYDFIDSAMLMQYYGYKMYTVIGPEYNIKVTTPMDFYLFKAILDAKEYEQIKVL